MNDLCPGLILPEWAQEAEVHPVTRRHQGESGPRAVGEGANSRTWGNSPQFPPCSRLAKRLYMNHVSNNQALLFSHFSHAFFKNTFPLQEGKPHKLPIFRGLRQGPREGELGVVLAEGLQLKNNGAPQTCRGFSPAPPTRAGPGIPWKPEQVKASPSPPLPSKSWLPGQHTTPPNPPSPTALHRPSLTEVGRPARQPEGG